MDLWQKNSEGEKVTQKKSEGEKVTQKKIRPTRRLKSPPPHPEETFLKILPAAPI